MDAIAELCHVLGFKRPRAIVMANRDSLARNAITKLVTERPDLSDAEFIRWMHEIVSAHEILSDGRKMCVYRAGFKALRIADLIVEKFRKDYSINLYEDGNSTQRVFEASELAASIIDSGTSLAVIDLPFITAVEGKPFHLHYEITYDEINLPLTE